MDLGSFIRLDKSGKILFANKAARNLLGENDILKSNWLKIFQGFSEEMLQEIIESKEPLSIDSMG